MSVVLLFCNRVDFLCLFCYDVMTNFVHVLLFCLPGPQKQHESGLFRIIKH